MVPNFGTGNHGRTSDLEKLLECSREHSSDWRFDFLTTPLVKFLGSRYSFIGTSPVLARPKEVMNIERLVAPTQVHVKCRSCEMVAVVAEEANLYL